MLFAYNNKTWAATNLFPLHLILRADMIAHAV